MTRIVTTRTERVASTHHLPPHRLFEQRVAELQASRTEHMADPLLRQITYRERPYSPCTGPMSVDVTVTYQEDQ